MWRLIAPSVLCGESESLEVVGCGGLKCSILKYCVVGIQPHRKRIKIEEKEL